MDAFSSSEEAFAAEALLEAYKLGSKKEVQQSIAKHSIFRDLDNQVRSFCLSSFSIKRVFDDWENWRFFISLTMSYVSAIVAWAGHQQIWFPIGIIYVWHDQGLQQLSTYKPLGPFSTDFRQADFMVTTLMTHCRRNAHTIVLETWEKCCTSLKQRRNCFAGRTSNKILASRRCWEDGKLYGWSDVCKSWEYS